MSPPDVAYRRPSNILLGRGIWALIAKTMSDVILQMSHPCNPIALVPRNLPILMTNTLNALLDLYCQRGQAQYGGEAVSQLEHALQCATLAEQSGQSAAVIVACLFHDLGHLVHHLGEDVAVRGIDDRHEYRAIAFLETHFPAAVTTPIRKAKPLRRPCQSS